MSLREALLQPIPGPNRVGEYLRYDPIYDKIKEARREDLDLPQGDMQQALKKADWQVVVRLANDALSQQSKDLQLAAWLTEGLLRRDGFGGLHDGLDLIIGLLEEFWDDLYPELEDDDAELRAVPLQWLAQSLEASVRLVPLNAGGHNWLDYGEASQVPTEEEADSDSSKRTLRQEAIAEEKLTPEEFEAEFQATPKAWYKEMVAELEASQAALATLEGIADQRFGSEAPSFIRLRNSLHEIRQTAGQLLARKLLTDPDPVEEVGLIDTGDMVVVGSNAAVVNVAAAAPRSLDEASARIAAAARFLRAQSPADPAPYLLLRGYRWGELRRTPGAVDPRLLEAPPTELRSRLKELALDGRWEEALEAGEEIMAAPYGRGWLDLQRYSVTACDALGSEYEALGAALRSALRVLLQEVPRLPSFTLLDDSPAANADTLRWLQAEALAATAVRPEESDAGSAAGLLPTSRDPLPRALRLAKQGETQEAVELLVQEANREQSERGRFLRRVQAASVMVEAGLENVALPILQDVVEQMETHQLERWEAADTVSLPLGLLYRCMTRMDPDDRQEELYLRICRLDPIRAIDLMKAARNGGSGG